MNWEMILLGVGGVALGAYLCHGIYKLALKVPLLVRSKEWVAVILSSSMLVVLILGVVACGIAVTGVVSGSEPFAFMEHVKNYLRPLMAIAVTVIMLIFTVPTCRECVQVIKTGGDTKLILKSVLRVLLILALVVYLVIHRWSWIWE